MASNNEVIIDTRLDVKGVEDGAKNIKNMLGSLVGKSKDAAKSMSDAFSKSQIPTAEYAQLERGFDAIEQKINKIGQAQDRYLATGGKKTSSTWKKYEYDLEQLGYEQDIIIAKMRQMERAGTAFGGTSSALDKAGASAKKASKFFGELNSKLNKNKGSFLQAMKSSLKYAFGFRSIIAVANKLRNVLSESFKNMAQFNDGVNPVNDALSRLKSALTNTKNSLASAFAPILTAIEPALTRLVNKISDVMTAFGMMVAKLTGQKTFIKAKAVQENYAESLKGTASAAKDAKKQLAGIYDLNVISKDDGSSGGGSASGTSQNDMFEVVNLDDNIELDPKSMGEKFSTAIINALNYMKKKVKDFDWNGLGETIGGFISGIDWKNITINFFGLVGEIVGGIATAIKEWHDTEPISASITELIIAAFLGVQILKIVSTVAPFFAGLSEVFALVAGGAGTLNEAMIAVFGPGSIIAGISGVLSGAILALTNFISILDGGFTWIKEVLMLLGITITAIGAIILGAPALVAGIVAAIVAVVANIVIAIKENWESIKKFFTETIPNFWNTKIVPLFKNIAKIFVDIFKGAIQKFIQACINAKTNVINIFEAIWGGIKKIINFILGGVESFANGVINAFNGAITAINGLHFTLPDWVPLVGGETLGFTIPLLRNVELPRLATGTVVPRQAQEFLAVLGDNNKEAEVVSPLSTMKQAFREALAESGIGVNGNVTVVLEGDAEKLFKVVRQEENRYYNRTGNMAFLH